MMHDRCLDNARNVLVPLARRRGELDQASHAAGTLDLGSALLSLALAEAEVDALALVAGTIILLSAEPIRGLPFADGNLEFRSVAKRDVEA